ncbi:MAG TPA: 4Fe-4S dicluster domain-containing protein [Syntrophorhabdaceae bacterium]|nr:4Fe-4S dicluster domain-containing protein [Syntrophorhabdaceae bacterium]
MKEKDKRILKANFLDEITEKSREKISSCYQCYRCTNGCPMAESMDIYPHKIMRYILLGERKKVLCSGAIWACLMCNTCSIRCPNDIDVAHVFETLRRIAIKDGVAANDNLWDFERLFLESIKNYGRLYELATILHCKLEKKEFFKDTVMGIKMMLKARMGILPHSIKDKRHIKGVFEKIEKGRSEV